MSRKKITQVVPGDGFEWVYYADGTKGMRGIGSPTMGGNVTQEVPEYQDMSARGGAVPWTPEMETEEQKASEDYGRDQQFRDYSDKMSLFERLHPETDNSREALEGLEELRKQFPEYLKQNPNGDIDVSGYWSPLPQKGK